MTNRHLLAISLLSLSKAALFHTVILVLAAISGRIRDGFFQLGFTYIVYPLGVSASICLFSIRKKIKRNNDENPSQESTAFLMVCVSVCLFFAMGASVFKQPAARLFLLDALMALLGCLSIPIHRLNQYIHYNRQRLISSKAMLPIFRFNNRLLLLVYLTIWSVSIPFFIYSQQPPRKIQSTSEWTTDEVVIKYKEEERDLQEKIGQPNSKDEYNPEYVYQSTISVWNFDSGSVFILLVVPSVIIIFISVLLYIRLITKDKMGVNDNNYRVSIEQLKKDKIESRSLSDYFSYSVRVKRIFYKKVQAHIKKGLSVMQSSTSVSIASDIGKVEDITTLERMYRKARYSEKGVSKEEYLGYRNRINDK